MLSLAPVQVQEDPFAVMESCQKAIQWLLRRSAAEGKLSPRGWIDAPYGQEEMAVLEEEIDASVRRHRRLFQAEG
jgi:hypothetical protein